MSHSHNCEQVGAKNNQVDGSSSHCNELAKVVGQAGEHMEDL